MLSKILRRTHMFLGLFFMPWMVLYAVSSIAMNHHWVHSSDWRKEVERTYRADPAEKLEYRALARRILADLNLDGPHSVQHQASTGILTIVRQDPVQQKRIRYNQSEQKLVVEFEVVQPASILRRLHVRKGYQSDYVSDDAWAVGVDLVIVACVFWVLSGLWMWWEMKVTRRWGAVALLSGVGLFLFFLVML